MDTVQLQHVRFSAQVKMLTRKRAHVMRNTFLDALKVALTTGGYADSLPGADCVSATLWRDPDVEAAYARATHGPLRRTKLMIAADTCNLRLLRRELRKGADVHQADAGCTWDEAHGGCADAAHIELCSFRKTALDYAVLGAGNGSKSTRSKIIRELLRAGADAEQPIVVEYPHAEDSRGAEPLVTACVYSGLHKLAASLLRNGDCAATPGLAVAAARCDAASVIRELRADSLDTVYDGYLPLTEAVRYKNLNAVRALLRMGADPQAVDENECDAWDYLTDDPPLFKEDLWLLHALCRADSDAEQMLYHFKEYMDSVQELLDTQCETHEFAFLRSLLE